jgi:hypothetical protein
LRCDADVEAIREHGGRGLPADRITRSLGNPTMPSSDGQSSNPPRRFIGADPERVFAMISWVKSSLPGGCARASIAEQLFQAALPEDANACDLEGLDRQRHDSSTAWNFAAKSGRPGCP